MTAAATAHGPTDTSSDSSDKSLDALLARMKSAHRRSGAPTYDDRIRSLEKLERAIVTRKSAIAEAISRDFGNRSKHESLVAEVFILLNAIKYARTNLRDWMEPQDREAGIAFLPAKVGVVPQPLGVVGIISPGNYPMQLALSPLTGALAAGNRAIIKPSELVPETSALLRDLIADTFPEDQVTVVTGGPEVGEAFSRLPFDHLVFTGSTRVGKAVMRAASENLVPVTLELGGKSPTIVGKDFSVPLAATRIMTGKLFNAGQTCIAPDYVLVHESRVDAFVEACKAAVAKMYPTLRDNPDYTSIINEKHAQRLQGYVRDARDKGAKVVEINPANESLEGTHKVLPTLLLDANDETVVMQEEIFGPILPVRPYKTLDDAIGYVNDHPRPLALYVFSHDRVTTDRVLAETTSGGVSINETMVHVAQDDLPFGGVGPSGMGHYHAREGFESFSKLKPVFRQSRINSTALLRAPYGKGVDALLKFLLS